jgi:hypothetical protein
VARTLAGDGVRISLFRLGLSQGGPGRLRNPFTRYREYKKNRGMSMFTDWIDWFGGYPFEVAKPEGLFDFYRERGFVLEKLVTVGGNLACNELVLRKKDGPA